MWACRKFWWTVGQHEVWCFCIPNILWFGLSALFETGLRSLYLVRNFSLAAWSGISFSRISTKHGIYVGVMDMLLVASSWLVWIALWNVVKRCHRLDSRKNMHIATFWYWSIWVFEDLDIANTSPVWTLQMRGSLRLVTTVWVVITKQPILFSFFEAFVNNVLSKEFEFIFKFIFESFFSMVGCLKELYGR